MTFLPAKDELLFWFPGNELLALLPLVFLDVSIIIIIGGFSLKKVCDGDGDWFMGFVDVLIYLLW